ncbi:hypothetical protein C0J52_22760 [Blattella germanica]|nr:hypothetical protein C0J52_22760 [Blattella germanica]
MPLAIGFTSLCPVSPRRPVLIPVSKSHCPILFRWSAVWSVPSEANIVSLNRCNFHMRD